METSRVLSLARRVIAQLLGDRRTLALIVVVPMILLSVAGILLNLKPGQATLAVVQQDEGASLGGRTLNLGEGMLEGLRSLGSFAVVVMTPEEARQQLASGEVAAAVTLPPALSASALSEQRVAFSVAYEGSNPGVARQLAQLLPRVAAQALGAQMLKALPVAAAQPRVELSESYLHGGPQFLALDFVAPALIGTFVFLFVFILTCVSFLRERLSGTLERLRATPVTSSEIVLGYMLGFLLFALLQGAITLLFTVLVLGVHYLGSLLTVFLVEALLAVAAVNLGIFFSTFARNEFQVLQFIPLVVVTQVFLGGAVWEVKDMPGWLQPIAWLMPLTHATKALRAVMIRGEGLGSIALYLAALLAMGAALVLLSARTAGRASL